MKKILFTKKVFFLVFCVFALVEITFSQSENQTIVVSSDNDLDLIESECDGNSVIITEKEIEESGKNSLVEILSNVSGLQVSNGSGGKNSLVVTMRGSSGDNPFSQVQVLIDGVSICNPDMSCPSLSSIPIEMIHEIKITEGGSSGKYGNGSISGVIDISTKESAKKISTDIKALYGMNNSYSGSAYVSLGKENMGVGLFTEYSNDDGYRKNSYSKIFSSMLTGFIDLPDDSELSCKVDYSNTIQSFPGSISKNQFNSDDTLSLNDKDVGNENFVNLLIMYDKNWNQVININIPITYSYKYKEYDFTSYYSFTDYVSNIINIKPKFNVTVNIDDIIANQFIIGFDFLTSLYSSENFYEEERQNLVYTYSINQFTYSPYIGYLLNYQKKFSFESYLRWDGTKNHTSKIQSNIDEKDFYSNFGADALLEYICLNWLNLFTKYSHTYRIPFIDEKAVLTSWGNDYYSELKSETGNSFDLGVKINLQNYLRMKLYGFYTIVDDEIAYIFDSNTFTGANENYDTTQRYGGGIQLDWNPIKQINFSTSAEYIHATFMKGDYTGNILPFVSPWKCNASVKITLPIKLICWIDFNYLSQKYASGDKLNESILLDSVYLLNAGITWKVPGCKDSLEINVNGSNLLNIKYPQYALYSYGQYYYYPAEGIKITTSISWKY